MDTAILGGVIRALLAAVGGGLVANGFITSHDLTVVSGAIATLLAAAWSVWQKIRASK